MTSQHQKQLMMNLNQNMVMNPMNSQPQTHRQMAPINRNYGLWAPPPHFQNPNPKLNPNPGSMKPPLPPFEKALGPRSDWKGKKMNNKLNDKRRNDMQKSLMAGTSSIGGINIARGIGNSNFNSYQPPTLNELQHQNRLKARKFFPKKKFSKNMNIEGNNNYGHNNSMSAPFAPRNTTSFIIRAKKSGGIASLVSPSPKTPAVLPTPILSPSREVLVDMAKEEWGVDGYGSMKGLIRLRSPGHEDFLEDEGGSSESDVEEHVEVERRLDHDLSRFEMLYNPNEPGGLEFHNVLENRVDDQGSHIAQLEEENLILKERLFLTERELGELRRRIQFLERKGDDNNEEVVDNDYENESGSRGEETHSVGDINNEGLSEDDIGGGSCKQRGEYSFEAGQEKKVENSDNGVHITDKIAQDDNKTDENKSVNEAERSNNHNNNVDGTNVSRLVVAEEEDKCTETKMVPENDG